MSAATAGYRGRFAGRARFTDLVAAEWGKLWAPPLTGWLLLGTALTVTGINANSARVNADRLAGQPRLPPGRPDPPFLFDPLSTAFADPAWQLLILAAGAFGAAALTGEYASGLVRATFAAVPDRRAVVAAKALVVAVALTGFGTVVSWGSFGVTQWLLRDQGGLGPGDPGALRAVTAAALLAPVCGLVGLALAAVVRHVAGGVLAVAGVLLLLPALFRGETYRWVAEIGNAMPLSAWAALVENPERPGPPEKYPVTVTGAWTVFAAWAGAAVVVAVETVRRRDV
ncbi:ABC transporter permease [Streptomyces sp. JNUCC 64]